MNSKTILNMQMKQLVEAINEVDKEVAVIAALLGVTDDKKGFLPLLIKIKEHIIANKNSTSL